MIGQRTAVLGRSARPTVQTQAVPLRERLVTAPAVAGRARAAAWVHRSVLMQLMLSMGLIAFAALIYLNQASQVAVLQFNIQDLQQKQADLQTQSANLYASASALQSVTRIEALAGSRLHMTKADITKTVWIYPVVPQISVPAVNDSQTQAQERSQPLHWMQNTLAFLSAQL